MVKLKKYSMEDLKKSFGAMSELEQALYIGGGKDYKFDKMGHIVSIEENEYDYSRAFCGSKFDLSYTFQNELTISSYPVEYQSGDGSYKHGYTTRMEGGDLGLFKFLADTTSVEWGAQFNGGKDASGSAPCVVTTSNDPTGCKMYTEEKDYDSYVHSHPNHDKTPSSADEDFFLDTEYKNYGIYTGGNNKEGEYSYPREWNKK